MRSITRYHSMCIRPFHPPHLMPAHSLKRGPSYVCPLGKGRGIRKKSLLSSQSRAPYHTRQEFREEYALFNQELASERAIRVSVVFRISERGEERKGTVSFRLVGRIAGCDGGIKKITRECESREKWRVIVIVRKRERVCTAFPSLVELRVEEMHTYGTCRIGYAVYKVYTLCTCYSYSYGYSYTTSLLLYVLNFSGETSLAYIAKADT